MPRKILAIIFSFFCIQAAAQENYLRLAYAPVDLQSLDLRTVDSIPQAFFLKQFAQTLVDTDSDGKIIPSIAKSWAISLDMKSYTFLLFDKIVFHNNKRLTAHDVAYTLDLVRFSRSNPIRYSLREIERITVHSKTSFTIHLRKPSLGLLSCLTSPLISILPYGSDGKGLIGSGPFTVSSQEKHTAFMHPFIRYFGPFPPKSQAFKVLMEPIQDADISFGWRQSKDGRQFQNLPTDIFSAYYFLVNPKSSRWKNLGDRLALMKILFVAREIIASPNLKNLNDIFPRGMRGFDISHSAFDDLNKRINALQRFPNFDKPIIFASTGPIPKFDAFAKAVLNRFGVKITNIQIGGPDTFAKLKSADADVFVFGWNSIFGHPDAVFLPFYILGIEEFNEDVRDLITSVTSAPSLFKQYVEYRRLASLLITDAFVFPHSQSMGYISYSNGINIPKIRFRYTVPLSQITRE